MIFNTETAQKTAELLLQINAIKLQPQNPFTWASGWQSPIYCDNRITLSYPVIRNYIREQMANHIEQQWGKPDLIAGVATGAIGIGVLIADFLNIPFCYVRPQPKAHGRKNSIEGAFTAGQKVVVIEDLISTGKSSLQAVDILREHNLQVKAMCAIFTYGFEQATKAFQKHNLEVHTLSNYTHLLIQAEKARYITETQKHTLSSWRSNPSQWQAL